MSNPKRRVIDRFLTDALGPGHALFFRTPRSDLDGGDRSANPHEGVSLRTNVMLAAAAAALGCQSSGGNDDPLVACTVTAPTACPDPAPRYADVAPVFNQRCAGPCHWGMPGGPWPLTDYAHIADWADVVRDEVLTCAMPPAGEQTDMTDVERTAILSWIRCGYLE
jgi:uncharacterized membrane protein